MARTHSTPPPIGTETRAKVQGRIVPVRVVGVQKVTRAHARRVTETLGLPKRSRIRAGVYVQVTCLFTGRPGQKCGTYVVPLEDLR